MKRSEAIKKLLPKVLCPHVVIKQENYDSGVYHDKAEKLLVFIEEELGMKPPPFYGDCSEDGDPLTKDWEKE